jgi:GMP synthase-like glutamine amidotransferase
MNCSMFPGAKDPLAPITSSIPASYAKWIESAGLRVAAIPFDLPLEELHSLLPQLAGVLFTGGGGQSARYMGQARKIYEYVHAAAKRGVIVPLWGSCLGFEVISELAMGGNYLTKTDAMGLELPVKLTNEDPWGLWKPDLHPASATYRTWLESKNVTSNYHSFGLNRSTFEARMAVEYALMGTSVDSAGQEFVAAMVSKAAPVIAVQFHPEKPAFEVGAPGTPKSPEALQVNQLLAYWFAALAQRSTQRFVTDAVLTSYQLSFKAKQVYTGFDPKTLTASHFQEIYLLPEPVSRAKVELV